MTATEGQTLIEINDAAFGYAGRAVVRVAHLSLMPGRCLGIFGQNGSGKTTLVRGLLGLMQPLAGRVDRHGGRTVRCGFLSQYRGIDLAWPMTGWDAVCLTISGRFHFGFVPRSARREAMAAMHSIGVAELADRPFAALSGGQQQRLLLAGALADRPHVLVLDEPTDGLDIASRLTLLAKLRDLKSAGLSIVIISHDLDDLLAVCDDVAWLHAGAEPSAPSFVERLRPEALGRRLLEGGGR